MNEAHAGGLDRSGRAARARGVVAGPWGRWSRHVGAACFAVLPLFGCSGENTTTWTCSLAGRKAYVADVMLDKYLWYDHVPQDIDYEAAASPEELLRQMTYRELDRWSGMQEAAPRREFFAAGRYQGFGYTLGRDAEGGYRISWTHEGSVAGRAGLERGMLLVAVNGRAVEDLSGGELGQELARDVVTHTLVSPDGTRDDYALERGDVDITSVKAPTVLDTPAGRVGYFMLTTFVAPAEGELRSTFAWLQEAGIEKLVVDLRYNSGGLLRIAAWLGSLIRPQAAGSALIVETYNDRHRDQDRERLLFDTAEGVDIDEVVFLTSSRTASASEQVINGLRPYLDVSVVGGRTLGKPVGSDSWEHCGYSIVPITFQSLNADGEGRFYEGIEPDCEASDDLLHPLGDPQELQLSAALGLLSGAGCGGKAASPASPREGDAYLPPGPLVDVPGLY